MSLAVAPSTTQRRWGSMPTYAHKTHQRSKCSSFCDHQTNLMQDVMFPASQHAQSSYLVNPSSPSKRSSMIALALPAMQHPEQQNALQLTADSMKSPIIQVPVPRDSLWECNYWCQPSPSGASGRHGFSDLSCSACAETITIDSCPVPIIRLLRRSTTLPPPPQQAAFSATFRTIKRISSAPLGDLPSISLDNSPPCRVLKSSWSGAHPLTLCDPCRSVLHPISPQQLALQPAQSRQYALRPRPGLQLPTKKKKGKDQKKRYSGR